MSWIDKILPSGVKKDESPHRASVPEGYGRSALSAKPCCIKLIWSATLRFVQNATIICGLVRAGVLSCV